MSRATLTDLQVAALWLDDYGVRYGGREEQSACKRVAEWLRFVAEQQEEYAARTPNRPALYAPSPMRVASLQRKRDDDAERRRLARLKGAFEAVWRARSA